MGIQANGFEIVLLETFPDYEEPTDAIGKLRDFKENLSRIEFSAEITVLLSEEQHEKFQCIEEEFKELTVPLESIQENAELLLNFKYGLNDKVVSRFKRSALVDIDPGLFQYWVSEGQFRHAPHDVYFTIGETVGKPEAQFPDLSLLWHYTPPPVFLPAWQPVKVGSSAPYTTISSWWSNWESFQGEVFNNEKRTSFLEYLELPTHTSVQLELALCMNLEKEKLEKRILESKDWKVRNSLEVSSTPEQYRSYIQNSRGEFSCAKPSCMRLQNAWISDRTLCYLASGKPAVVQHTGPSRFLPDDEGLVRFRNFNEAVQGLANVEKDYERHSRYAIALTEEYFDAKKVAGRVLERILEIRAKHH